MPEVRVLKCARCGALDAGPRLLCPRCHAQVLEPSAVSGAGKLLSWTVIRRPPARLKAKGPYAVCVVDLDAGVRVTGRLDSANGSYQTGARVQCVEDDGGVAIFAQREA